MRLSIFLSPFWFDQVGCAVQVSVGCKVKVGVSVDVGGGVKVDVASVDVTI
jgi:hypothetical protein